MQQFHRHPQLRKLIVLPDLLAGRFLARSSLPILTADELFNLPFTQTIALANRTVRLSCGIPGSNSLGKFLSLCVLSSHTDNLLLYFLFYNRRSFFYCPFLWERFRHFFSLALSGDGRRAVLDPHERDCQLIGTGRAAATLYALEARYGLVNVHAGRQPRHALRVAGAAANK